MRILFDLFCTQSESYRYRGIGQLNKQIFNELQNYDYTNHFYALFHKSEKIPTELNLQRCEKLIINTPLGHLPGAGENVLQTFTGNKFDIIHLTNIFDAHMINCYRVQSPSTICIATIYDLIPLIFPQQCLPDRQNEQMYYQMINHLKTMDHIIAISEKTKDDIVNYLNYPEENITVIYPIVQKCFRNMENMSYIEQQLNGINRQLKYKEFIFCPYGDNFRKNIGNTIEAYAHLPRNLRLKYPLVILSKPCSLPKIVQTTLEGDRQKMNLPINTSIRDPNIQAGMRIIFLDMNLTSEQIAVIYNSAKVTIYVSLYEGFGLPAIESILCKTPVIVTENSSMIEITGLNSISVNPYDIENIKNTLKEMLTNDVLYEQITESLFNNVRQNENFNRRNIIRQYIHTYHVLYNKFLQTTTLKHIQNIGIISTFPPVKSGISRYTMELIDKLRRHLPENTHIDMIAHDKILQSGEFNPDKYNVLLLNVGCNEYHIDMLYYLLTTPYNNKAKKTLCILHDCKLGNMLNHDKNHVKRGLFQKYITEDPNMSKVYQQTFVPHLQTQQNHVYQQEKRYLDNFKSTFHEKLFDYSNAIIFHSYHFLNNVEEKNKAKAFYNTLGYNNITTAGKITNNTLPLLPPTVESIDDSPIGVRDSRLKNKDEYFVFACMGHITLTKRVHTIIRAFEKLCDYVDKNSAVISKKPILLFVGENHKLPNIKPLFDAGMLDIEEYVKKNNTNIIITGYVNEPTYNQYLNVIDVGINLRFPTNGETSSSLLDFISHSIPTIVSNCEYFGELPNFIDKIDSKSLCFDANEIEQLFTLMVKYLTNNQFFVDRQKQVKYFYTDNYTDMYFINNLMSAIIHL